MQIYIAHHQKTSNALNVYHYTANRNVFRCLQKVSLLTVRSLRQSGNKFHTKGPATEKSRRANVLCLWCGMFSIHRPADRRWCRDTISETGWQKSSKYCGAWHCRQLNIMTQWHELDQMQIICTLLQTDNHASISSPHFLQTRCSSWSLFACIMAVN